MCTPTVTVTCRSLVVWSRGVPWRGGCRGWRPRRSELHGRKWLDYCTSVYGSAVRPTFELGLIGEQLFLIVLASLRHGPQQLGVLLVLPAERPLTTHLTLPCTQHSTPHTYKILEDLPRVLQVILGQGAESCCSTTLWSSQMFPIPPGVKCPSIVNREVGVTRLSNIHSAKRVRPTFLVCPSHLCVSVQPLPTHYPPSASCKNRQQLPHTHTHTCTHTGLTSQPLSLGVRTPR